MRFFIDTHKFIRSLNIKKYFLSHPVAPRNNATVSSVKIDSGLRNKSVFNSQNSNNHYVEVFKNLVLKDIDSLTVKEEVNPKYINEGFRSLEK